MSAFSALTRLPQPKESELLPDLVKALLTAPGGPKQLLELPFPPNLRAAVDELLTTTKGNVAPLGGAAPPQQQHRILAAWRLKHNDFRGAAAALYPRLEATQKQILKPGGIKFTLGHGNGNKTSVGGIHGDDNGGGGEMERGLDEMYLAVINFLECAGGEQGEGWVLSRDTEGRRKAVSSEGLRKDWLKELDRRSVIEGGKWTFGAGRGGDDAMEVG